jgi:YXWGXW repeat-containing protein
MQNSGFSNNQKWKIKFERRPDVRRDMKTGGRKMFRDMILNICIFVLLGLLGGTLGAFPVVAAEKKLSDNEAAIDVLAYGPIHEAFVETIAFDPEPGIIVPKAPPEVINEIPPEQKPEGDVQWIPGYWGWDDDRNDFIWISGTWRVVPPGREWIPGYWVNSTGDGYQWISGYWAPENNSATTYLPEPPESVEAGPNVNAPSSNHTWIPGSWVWYRNAYAWRPGYWAVIRPDWVWMPAHYVWTPRGYVFVGGYWDFPVGFRGVLFAPVAFGFNVSFGSGFYFTPSFMIDVRIFSDCLFLRPDYHHYYFGDYYAPRYYRRGIFPWFSPHRRHHGYDPIYAHQRWKHRNNPHWEKDLHRTYQLRRNHEEARPPRNFHESKKIQQASLISSSSGRSFKKPFFPLTKKRKGLPRFESLSRNERTQIAQHGKQLRNLSNQRLKLESRGLAKPSVGSAKKIYVDRVKLPYSPIAAKPLERTSTKKTTPNRYKNTQLNSAKMPLGRRSSKAPGTSKKIKISRRTIPKSPRLTSQPVSRSKTTASQAGKVPPVRYKTSKTNPTVEPLKRRSIGQPETSKKIGTERRTVPKNAPRSANPPTVLSRSTRPEAPKPGYKMVPPKRGASLGRWGKPVGTRTGMGGNRPQFPGK